MTFSILSLITLAVLLGTAAKLLHRHVLKETEPYAYALLNNIVGALFFLQLALRNFSIPTEGSPWLILTLASALWAIVAVGKFIAYNCFNWGYSSPPLAASSSSMNASICSKNSSPLPSS